ncbi:hypothetical protein AY601_4114 [Pedobacter cryoconitis]|uniref:Uncharacterized protein n=1 Tax=Pedobacter cryoconitis TaxID=188932 RepID=A0A127VI12_9SPHI|nr:hypothetical protein [Pedobacter cryoconitis]AMQ00965.1 hypothetical protein AY601_4114 [Pedobacter cryoconitis]
MESIEQLSKIIVETTRDLLTHKDMPGDVGTPENFAIECAEQRITWYINDVLAVINNINQTSLNKMDRAQRLIELEEKYGIPKTHLIIQ